MKPKTCKQCKEKYQPTRPLQSVCSTKCASLYGRKTVQQKIDNEQKLQRKRLKAKKEGLKTLGDHKKEVQTAFNEFIRLRDANQPCISCQRHHQGQYHAGHYRSVGSAPNLRFDEDNVHKQCAPCNNHLSGNPIQYRVNLIEKIGLAEVERIESDNEPKHYTVEQLNELKKHYRQLCRELKRAA